MRVNEGIECRAIGRDLRTVRETRGVALAIFMLVCATACFSVPLMLNIPIQWHVWAVYLLVVPALGLLLLSVMFVAKGTGRISRMPFWTGFCFIVGGISFDLWATLFQSPDLALEGNKVISTLIRTNHDVDFIYVYGLGLQSLLACVMILLWAGFLRHRHTWFNTSMNHAPRTFAEFLKAVTGGGRMSWRQYVAPPRTSERLCLYHVLQWTLPPMLLYAAAYRWYVGLDWFGLVPAPFSMLGARLIGGIAAGIFSAFFFWLYYEFSSRTGEVETVADA